jgi:hypothetical protein
MRVACLAACLAVAWITLTAWPVAAQTEATQPTLTIGPLPEGAGTIAVEPNVTVLQVPWSYKFSNAATAAVAKPTGKATIEWSAPCQGVVRSLGLDGGSTDVPFETGKTDYMGTAILGLHVPVGTRGAVSFACHLEARSAGGPGILPTNASLEFPARVAYLAGLQVVAAQDHLASGPEKIMRFKVFVANNGNARTLVSFTLQETPTGKWNAILPEVLSVEPGQAESAIFAVATPFHDGYVGAEGTYVLRATPAAADDASLVGSPVDIPLHASVHGWYMPGPSPILVLAVLGIAAVLRRRP